MMDINSNEKLQPGLDIQSIFTLRLNPLSWASRAFRIEDDFQKRRQEDTYHESHVSSDHERKSGQSN